RAAAATQVPGPGRHIERQAAAYGGGGVPGDRRGGGDRDGGKPFALVIAADAVRVAVDNTGKPHGVGVAAPGVDRPVGAAGPANADALGVAGADFAKRGAERIHAQQVDAVAGRVDAGVDDQRLQRLRRGVADRAGAGVPRRQGLDVIGIVRPGRHQRVAGVTRHLVRPVAGDGALVREVAVGGHLGGVKARRLYKVQVQRQWRLRGDAGKYA